ncbi:uncharacterized protein LOC134204782 [Armigeres subalbatus]|uniref:uncharacterized protein LOC134204782 n=1 Tax=Armigeres subalbatus TaxID=124917 RepID=UPI002ED25FE1
MLGCRPCIWSNFGIRYCILSDRCECQGLSTMKSKMKVTRQLISLLLFFFCRFVGNSVDAELLPENVPLSQTTSLNPLMPNNEQSVKDCPYTYFPYAKRGMASSIFAEPYRNKTFAHVVKLDTAGGEASNCVGVVVDQLHILTTKECAQKQPQTISFQNETLPRWGILSTKYHTSLDVAVLQLKSDLSIDEQIIPACFWSSPTKNGFSSVQYITKDSHIDGFTVKSTKCTLRERKQCYDDSRKKANGFVQVGAISNYKKHPFVLALGSGNDGALLEVSQYSDWLFESTGTSMDPIECALKYYKLREYDDSVVAHRDGRFQSVQLQKAYIASSGSFGYKTRIGHYVEDPVKDTVVTYSCYGTLIHRQYVLTSASCINKFKDESLIVQMRERKKYELSSDPDYLVQERSRYREEVTVDRVFLHPGYSEALLENDLALLHLDPVELSFDEYFKPACLWTHDSIGIKEFQTDGHGPQRTVEFLEERVELLLKDRTETELYLISKILDDCPIDLLNNQICVGEEATLVPGTCTSNLGSAMSREITAIPRFFYDYVFAINSEGNDCGINTPSKFTTVSPYIKWIDSVVFGENVQFNNLDVYYGDECNLQDGTSGVCLTVPECPGVIDDLTEGSTGNVEKCGFMKNEVLICCSAVDSAQNRKPSEQLNEVVAEIEKCPELYSDLRDQRSPHQLWSGNMTFLGLLKSHSSQTTCDATLISKNFFITSASCFKRFSSDESLFVEIGQTTRQQHDVEKTVVHSLYTDNSHENNLALLKLKTAIVVSGEVIPACLWKNRTHVPFALSVLGTKEKLFDLQAYPLYQQRCEEKRFSNVTSTELCVSFEGPFGKYKPSICHDAGSGIYNFYAQGTDEKEVAYLVGLYTRGTDCEDDAVGVFTRISHHFGWIKSVIYRLA